MAPLCRTVQFFLVGSILLLGGASTEAQTVATFSDVPKVETGSAAKPVAAWTALCARMPASVRSTRASPPSSP